MSRAALEVADIFRDHGPAWRRANAGHVSLGQMKVMSAIESCRTAALGGHVARCEDCAHTTIPYNSCRNRHCPKCQGAAAREWMEDREAELLPVPYFHIVFTLPAALGDIAYQNKAAIYDLLFKVAAETMLTIAADPKHLGARIAITAVLHTWGSAMTHHPHVHMIVPGGGIALDGSKWIACKSNFFLPVLVLSKLFRRLMLEKLAAAHNAGKLTFFGEHAHLADAKAFAAFLAPLKRKRWFVYSKRPFAGPKAVLAYLARYTHRVVISNSRLIAADETSVTFKVKDYRIQGPGRYMTMTLGTHEFIRRFLLHVLPKGFHRIRHYGLLAGGARDERLAQARQLLEAAAGTVTDPEDEVAADDGPQSVLATPCPCCGGRMIVIETFEAGCRPRHPPTSGSTRHDRATLHLPSYRASLAPVIGRPRRRSSVTTRSAADRAPVAGASQRPMQLGAAASPHRQPSLLRTPPLASIEQPLRDREIPIALAAPPCLTTRGFLPWRLSDAGPGACPTVAMGRHPKPFTEPDLVRVPSPC